MAIFARKAATDWGLEEGADPPSPEAPAVPVKATLLPVRGLLSTVGTAGAGVRGLEAKGNGGGILIFACSCAILVDVGRALALSTFTAGMGGGDADKGRALSF